MKHITEIIERDAQGRVLFRSVEPRHMRSDEVRRECKKWGANFNNVQVTRTTVRQSKR